MLAALGTALHLVLVAGGVAADAHAQQLAAAGVRNLREAVLAPAVAAEGVPAVHRCRLAGGHVTEAALALQRVCMACTQADAYSASLLVKRITEAAVAQKHVCLDTGACTRPAQPPCSLDECLA